MSEREVLFMAHISCACTHWNCIGEHTNYCERCGRQLDTDQFTELIATDKKATRELGANHTNLRYRLLTTFLFAGGLGMLVLDAFGWGIYWCSVIGFFGLLSALMQWVRKRIFARYHRLWELPTVFRPSVPKE